MTPRKNSVMSAIAVLVLAPMSLAEGPAEPRPSALRKSSATKSPSLPTRLHNIGIAQALDRRPRLIPLREMQLDAAALRAEFAAEFEPTGLQILGEVDLIPLNDVLQRASLTAAKIDAGLSGLFFVRRDSFIVQTVGSGVVPVATVNHSLARDGNRITSRFVIRYDDRIDTFARKPTGIGGVVIEHVTVLSFDDIDAYIKAVSARNERGNRLNMTLAPDLSSGNSSAICNGLFG